jgi:hypothetical protein
MHGGMAVTAAHERDDDPMRAPRATLGAHRTKENRGNYAPLRLSVRTSAYQHCTSFSVP